jgi:4-amino-4-deoxy-L-arabinose transferase-like glycosyltransferase
MGVQTMTTTSTPAVFPYPGSATYDAAQEPQPPTGVPQTPARTERRWSSERLGLIGLLFGTAVLYLWGLGASGYANDFYAAAVQAGTKSWKAFFFGSFDSSNFITVDKPPASLWPMELAGRIFGFNSWSMLVPQAIEGVLAVWLLYATVRRWFGARAALLAGALLALTPVAVLMFRFNNPDALMTLLIVAAAYCVTRAIDSASTRWLGIAGLIMGFSFLAKGLQPFTVIPSLAVAYLVAAPTSLRRRALQLLAAGAAVVVGAGWWVLAVELTPAADRPYIGGSGNNTALGLAFGYNGLSRITGGSGPGGGGANFSGATGIGRLFNSLDGGQIAWLLPTALVAVVALAVLTRRLPRTDRTRAALLLWGGWLLVTGGVLSFASGIIHTYYTVELAPAIAALVAIGATQLWRLRSNAGARWTLAAGVLITGIWSWALLRRASDWHPWVAYLVLAAAVAAAGMLLVADSMGRRLAIATAVVALVAVGGGSAAYAVDTAATAHTGAVPMAGPSTGAGVGGPGGGLGGGAAGGARGGFGGGRPAGGAAQSGGSTAGGPPSGGFGGGELPAGGPPGLGGNAAGNSTGNATSGATGEATGNTARGGVGGGLGGATAVNSALTAALKATNTKWAAAAIGSQSAGPLELASGKAVMAIGGFSGSDDAPTLAQFEADVHAGQIRYFIAGGGIGGGGGPGGAGGGQGSSSAITSWVQAHFKTVTIGGTTVYDLRMPSS